MFDVRDAAIRPSVGSTWRVFAALLLAVAVGTGCNGDPGGGDAGDTGAPDVADVDAGDATDVADTTEPMDTTDADTGEPADGGDADAADGSSTILCQSCSSDEDCGGSDDQCLQLLDGESRCGRACDTETEGDCPDGYQCSAVEQGSTAGQCVPDKLTCVDRCSDKNCSDGEVCDPIIGECREPLGLCDTECTVDSICGDGPEDRCLSVPGTSDGERMCATGCNPEADNPGCPVDYNCAALQPDENPEEGVCFPLRGTCRDRCADKNCPDGQNCNKLTGQCEQAEYGACEKGCQSDAQCGGQGDRCLTLPLADGPRCWLDCSGEGGSCPSGYQCAKLNSSTLAICIPESMKCSPCEGTDCFPGGACDPSSGMCTELDKDCTQAGCANDGEVCDPRSADCVDVGRSCSGDSWAEDCDNVVTTCTTHRSGSSGTCERICSDGSECGADEDCVDTNLRRMCLGPERGGPDTCGTLRTANTQIGEPCEDDGECSGDASMCVTNGNLDGFCSASCSSDADCPGNHRCGNNLEGDRVCLPPQCACAGDAGLGNFGRSILTRAFLEIDVDQCDLTIDRDRVAKMAELGDNPLASARLEDWLTLPLVTQQRAADGAAGLDEASDTPASALEHAADVAGMSVSPSAGSYPLNGSNSKLTQAVSKFINAAGGSPNTSQLETKASNVPDGFEDVAAPIIAAAADAYEDRESALTNAGWMSSRRKEAFEGAPYLLLPGTNAQAMKAPDLSKQSVKTAYGKFPAAKFGQAAGDLGATIDDVVGSAGDSSGWTNFSYIVDTPAGKIVLGDVGDTTYDPSSNSDLSGDIAVLIDAGGNDTYKVPAGANTSSDNGVALTVDLGGDDTYAYRKAGDPKDTSNLLTSDGDGRKAAAGPNSGPVSLSTTARQGAGRVGIGMLIDYGSGKDSYESLRMSQGAAVFGVGLMFDGGGNNTYAAEALSQGAALGGLGVLWSAGGPDDYKVWHGGQGFGTAAGTGVLFDRSGGDGYEAVPGEAGGAGILYESAADKGASNGNYAQGASRGVASTGSATGLAGGYGVLRDAAGKDSYTSGTYAQGYGTIRGLGVLSEGKGNDTYSGRRIVQGAGQLFGGGVLDERSGSDVYNENADRQRDAQGFGEAYGWGVMRDRKGQDEINYGDPGGGLGFDGGMGFALFEDGKDTHTIGSRSGWGQARNDAQMGDTLYGAKTVGIFVDVYDDDDNYNRPNIGSTNIGNDSDWLQPDPSTDVEKGVGIDE